MADKNGKEGDKEKKLWTSDSLKETIRKKQVIIKENKTGKAASWKKFYYAETTEGIPAFG